MNIFIKRPLTLLALMLVCMCASTQQTESVENTEANKIPNNLILLKKTDLESVKAAYENEGTYGSSIALIVDEADKALKLETLSVTTNPELPASNDKHDYFSVGPYWWPDPKSKNGLPWINRDGETNPTFRGLDSDNKQFQILVAATHDLSLAYYFTQDERYAQKAHRLIHGWFIDPETKMNPHLNFAQSIPGKVAGRGIGIIEFRNLLKVLDAAVLIQPYTDAKFEEQFNEWVTILFAWLLESQNGQDEARMHNNHGTFYDALVTGIALHLDYPEIAKKLTALTKQRISAQIEDDGQQPHELTRTRPFNYTAFNLNGFTSMARMSKLIDVDLWKQPSGSDERILKALTFAFENLDNTKFWPGKQEKYIDYYKLVAPALFVRLAYADNAAVSAQIDAFIIKLATRSKQAQHQLAVCSALFNYPYSTSPSSDVNYRSCIY